MKFLITGIGSIGQRHYRNLRKLGETVAVVRSGGPGKPNRSFVQEFLDREAREGRQVIQYFDLDEAIASFHPDAIFITNPNHLHFDIGLRAARRGLPIFFEKPLVHEQWHATEIRKAISNSPVMVGYNLRFHPLLRKMKDLYDGGAIGAAVAADITVGENIADWHPWENYLDTYAPYTKTGGGVLLCFSHDIDYTYWFFGKPSNIQAAGGKITPLGGDGEDMVKSLWEYENGPIVSIHLDYWQRPPVRRFSILGDRGGLHWDYHSRTLTMDYHDARAPQVFTLPVDFDRNDMFIAEARHFIECMKTGEEPLISFEQGADVLDICMHIRAASENNRVQSAGGTAERSRGAGA